MQKTNYVFNYPLKPLFFVRLFHLPLGKIGLQSLMSVGFKRMHIVKESIYICCGRRRPGMIINSLAVSSKSDELCVKYLVEKPFDVKSAFFLLIQCK